MPEGQATLPVRRCRPALGTFVEIEVESIDAGPIAHERAAPDAIDAAFAAIARVDAAMSFHRADSDISRINRAPRGTVLGLDPWTVEVLQLAARLQRDSAGIFDCAVGAELISSGLLPGTAPAGGSGSLLHGLSFLDDQDVRIEAPVCLDLGGLAKGYAVDRAIDALRASGARQACVNAGGDLRVLGPRPQPIYLRTPSPAGHLHAVGSLADGAIATSSTVFSGGLDAQGRWRAALVDPRTRRPIAARQSFSVVAELCALADGLTKVVAVTGRTDHPSLRRHGASAFVV